MSVVNSKIFADWLQDLPQQFQGKTNIESLIAAFSRQLEEIQKVFDDLEEKTSIDTAVGENLDMVGDIVCLSRKDAHSYINRDGNFEMTDDLYRKILKFKILKNTSEATYYDIMDGVSLLWNLDNVKYREDKSRPATYILDLQRHPLEGESPIDERVLTIKAAGVNSLYAITFFTATKTNYLKCRTKRNIVNMKTQFFGTVRCLDGSYQLNGTIHLDATSDKNVTRVRYEGFRSRYDFHTVTRNVYDIPDRIIVMSNDDTYVTDAEASITGRQGNKIQYSYDGDGLKVETLWTLALSNDGAYFACTGSAKSAYADDCIVSRSILSGSFEDDGLMISYGSDIEIKLEMQATMT